MSRNMDIRKIAISTLSPIHIGCGMVYEPSNFVIHEQLLHALDEATLAEDLTDDERKTLGDASSSHEPIARLQTFFRGQAPRFAELAKHRVAVVKDIADEYARNAGQAVQRGSSGQPVYNMFPIARTAFQPYDNTPYIPGSSIKGSIRTAWLDHLNKGNPLPGGEKSQDHAASRKLQERLLGYTSKHLENDPFRRVRIADASVDENASPPPTQVLYAISKKKKFSDRGSPELRVFLETVPEAMPGRFHGDVRLDGAIDWAALCDACNRFYRPQLEAELDHQLLGALIDPDWKRLVSNLLQEEMMELISARQGFLLRIGRHSGAESVTLEGLRDIKILGERGKPFRANTTEKRFASHTKRGIDSLLPFGWVWVEACEGSHQGTADALRAKLAKRSGPILEAHADRLARSESAQQERASRRHAAEQERKAMAQQREAEEAERVRRAQEIAAMTPGRRAIAEFVTQASGRIESLRGSKEKLNADFHNRARALVQQALSGSDWNAEEKIALADAIAEWLPKIVTGIDKDKDQLKKLKLTSLRGG